jgi:hypothetical protein
MRKLLVGLVLLAPPALAGEVYGTVSEGGKPVAEATAVEAKCGEHSYPAVKTDKAGSFRVVVQEKGKCTVTVRHKGQSPTLEFASYDEGVQVDLVLVAENGTYALKRK